MAQMKLRYPIQIGCKAGYSEALAQTGTRNIHRFSGMGILVDRLQHACQESSMQLRIGREDAVPKLQLC